MRKIKCTIAMILVVGIMASLFAFTAFAQNVNLNSVGFDAKEFASPSMQYRPGVRWWWPGGAVQPEEIKKEINWLADNGFSAAEINPFGKNVNISVDPKYLDPSVDDIYNDAFYANVEVATKEAAKRGIKLTINLGSGWNSSGPSVGIGDTGGNMALGRQTVTATANTALTVSVPGVAEPQTYITSSTETYEWSSQDVKFLGLLISKIDESGTGAANITANPNMYDPATKEITATYSKQTMLKLDDSVFYDPSLISQGKVTFTPKESGQYEVVGLYSVPTGEKGVDTRTHDYVLDHQNAEVIASYMRAFIGESKLKPILDKYPGTIDTVFNDSYELKTYSHFNAKSYELAKDAQNNGLGYDFSKYLPVTFKAKATTEFLKYSGMTTDEFTRVTYDYNVIVNKLYQQGMEAFQTAAKQYGLSYRQQAYNPPVDTIGAAKYVDIPEEEQGGEMRLRRASSGAHLYGRNVTTAEQYTLGCSPLTNSLELVKNGVDVMATSGINNFFYHGMSYSYFGSAQAQQESYYSAENGWNAFPDIGINITPYNTLFSKYYTEINSYAARVNYMMQAGSPSSDFAVYLAGFNTQITDTDAIKSLNSYGLTWDAINDDSIQNRIDYRNGKIVVDGVAVSYDGIIVQSNSMPVETIKALEKLANKGANIIFYNTTPSRIPGYANGNYAQADAQVLSIATAMTQLPSVYTPTTRAAIDSLLPTINSAKVSTAANGTLRTAKRNLENGGQIVFYRNTATTNNALTIKVDDSFENFYWLDQNTGKINKAAKNANGEIAVTIVGGGTNPVSGNYANSNSVALLCLPKNATVNDTDLSAGLPLTIDTGDKTTVATLSDFNLTVSADNIGSAALGDMQTVTYTGNVLGKWNDNAVLGGALKYVAADGSYKTTWNVPDISVYAGKRILLDLGSVYTAATVKINGQVVAKAIYSPYIVDVSKGIVQGNNDIEIIVTPKKNNRIYGLRTAYDSNTTLYAKYAGEKRFFTKNTSFQDSGLVGPVSVKVADSVKFEVISAKATKGKIVVGEDAKIAVNASGLKDVNTFEIYGTYTGDLRSIQLASGLIAVKNTFADGKFSLIVGSPGVNGSISGNANLLSFVFGSSAPGSVGIEINKAIVGGVDSSDSTFSENAVVNPAKADIAIYNTIAEIADINHDGKVSPADLSLAMKYYGYTQESAGWNNASKCDINGDGQVDMADLIIILVTYENQAG